MIQNFTACFIFFKTSLTLGALCVGSISKTFMTLI